MEVVDDRQHAYHHNHSRTLSSSLSDVDYYGHTYSSSSRASSPNDDDDNNHHHQHDDIHENDHTQPHGLGLDSEQTPLEQHSRSSSQVNTFQPPQRRSSIKNRQNRNTSTGSAYSAVHSASSSLSGASVPSFSAFRQQAPSVPPSSSPSAVWGRLSRTTPLHTSSYSLSSAAQASPRLVAPAKRSISADSRLPLPSSSGLSSSNLPTVAEVPSPRPSPRTDTIPSYVFPSGSAHDRTISIDSRITGSEDSPSLYSPRASNIPIHKRYASSESLSRAHIQTAPIIISNPPSKRTSRAASTAGQGSLGMASQFDAPARTPTNESLTVSESADPPRPKSPGALIGNLFGWKSGPSPSGKTHSESPSTNFSDRSMSPLPSPQTDKPLPPVDTTVGSAHSAFDNVLEKKPSAEYFDHPQVPILAGSPENITHVKELERELAQVSAELAASIRREMDLEDDLDRMRTELPPNAPSDSGRRGSDYFSDSGASSVRFPITDYDSKLEQLERSLRKVEQEKANLKLEMASRLQSELSRRRDLEQMVQNYELQLKQSIDHHGERSDMESRVEELESILEDTRRLLNQERQAKGSFEDLYSASREQLERNKNECDNLRDEIVPQLKARVEGLESDAAEKEALAYENARMQQELTSLQERLGGRYGAIAEEGGSAALSRSGTHGKRGGSLTRNGSVRETGPNGRQRSGSTSVPLTAEGMKEVEDQRDALHKALKLLIGRHEKQRREHERAIKKMTKSRGSSRLETLSQHARGTAGNGGSSYSREVAFLKEEVATLRKRTEDALEQKYQYEKNLSGIKMDLDRADQETRGLRSLLSQSDILAASGTSPVAGKRRGSEEAMDFPSNGGGNSEDLATIISTAESERDAARQAAQQYRQRAAQNPSSPANSTLLSSAKRMDELAEKLETQVTTTTTLRERLTSALAKGEAEQKVSAAQIEEMQKRLAGLEDAVVAAAQHSENWLHSCEADLRSLEEAKEGSRGVLMRLEVPASGLGISTGSVVGAVKGTPRLVVPGGSSPAIGSTGIPAVASASQSPNPAMSTPASAMASPLLSRTAASSSAKIAPTTTLTTTGFGLAGGLRKKGTKLSDTSLLELSRTHLLDRKVRELENLLREAEGDLEGVLQRVNGSQVDVSGLQNERENVVVNLRGVREEVEGVRRGVEAL